MVSDDVTRVCAEDKAGTRCERYRAWLPLHRAEVERQQAHWRMRELIWSSCRLVSFVAVIALYVASPGLKPTWVAGIVAGICLFVLSIRFHQRARERREMNDGRLLVIKESLSRAGGAIHLVRSRERPAPPSENDAALLPPLEPGRTCALTDQERDDLDFYAAPVGLFGLLNRTSTTAGARRLDGMLNHPCVEPDRIQTRQTAVAWLAERHEARIRLMAAAAALRKWDESVDGFVMAVRQAEALPFRRPASLMRFWGLVSAAVMLWLLWRFAATGTFWTSGAVGLLLLNGLLLLRVRGIVSKALKPWRYLGPTVRAVLLGASQGVDDLEAVADLEVLRDRFTTVTRPDVLPALCRVLDWANIGGATHVVLNVLLFYDLHLAVSILSRVTRHREALLSALSSLAELEALNSLACFACEQPHACFPELTVASGLTIEEGLHPLISPGRAVPNSVSLVPDQRLWVITGSNMAGKSTMLRMTGLHVLLAQMGSAVPARRMCWRPMRLITDLSVRDNLAEDESYFLAEVRHLRRMVLPPPDPAPILGLIDEPFRGTNSQEQMAASLAVVEHLLASPHFFIVATHEARLTSLADGRIAANYHFTESFEAGGMVFDHVLRPGPARTRNALRVLEAESYPPELLAAARGWLMRVGSEGGDGLRPVAPGETPSESVL